MKVYEDLTPAMKAILFHYIRGYTMWSSFEVDEEKINGISNKWAENYGIHLPSWKRSDRKVKALPTAVGLAGPVIGKPGRLQVIVMATPFAGAALPNSPWAREKWIKRPPEFSDFVMVREPREGSGYVWTWRIQEHVMGGLEKYLTMLVKACDAAQVRHEASHWVRFYPMFSGIRRQIRRLYRAASKLWLATQKSEWPGPNPEDLPQMGGFRKDPGKSAGKPRKAA